MPTIEEEQRRIEEEQAEFARQVQTETERQEAVKRGEEETQKAGAQMIGELEAQQDEATKNINETQTATQQQLAQAYAQNRAQERADREAFNARMAQQLNQEENGDSTEKAAAILMEGMYPQNSVSGNTFAPQNINDTQTATATTSVGEQVTQQTATQFAADPSAISTEGSGATYVENPQQNSYTDSFQQPEKSVQTVSSNETYTVNSGQTIYGGDPNSAETSRSLSMTPGETFPQHPMTYNAPNDPSVPLTMDTGNTGGTTYTGAPHGELNTATLTPNSLENFRMPDQENQGNVFTQNVQPPITDETIKATHLDAGKFLRSDFWKEAYKKFWGAIENAKGVDGLIEDIPLAFVKFIGEAILAKINWAEAEFKKQDRFLKDTKKALRESKMVHDNISVDEQEQYKIDLIFADRELWDHLESKNPKLFDSLPRLEWGGIDIDHCTEKQKKQLGEEFVEFAKNSKVLKNAMEELYGHEHNKDDIEIIAKGMKDKINHINDSLESKEIVSPFERKRRDELAARERTPEVEVHGSLKDVKAPEISGLHDEVKAASLALQQNIAEGHDVKADRLAIERFLNKNAQQTGSQSYTPQHTVNMQNSA